MNLIILQLLFITWPRIALSNCTSDIAIDAYQDRVSKKNKWHLYTFDDGTTSGFTRVLSTKKVFFEAISARSYVFTEFPCQNLTDTSYDALTFSLRGPENASYVLELQTSASCSTKEYASNFISLTGVTSVTQNFTIPLSLFEGANLEAIKSIVFQDLTLGDWEIGETELSRTETPAHSISREAQDSSNSINSLSSTITQQILRRQNPEPCEPHLIDDFASQSRLTFLFYNAKLFPSSDDGTMKPVTGRVDTQTSVIVADNHVTLTPVNDKSYWFTQLGCLKATNTWGGIGMTIKAARGTTLRLEIGSDPTCTNTNPKNVAVSSTQLGWNFDGTEKYYQIPFSKFPGLDTDHLVTLLFSEMSKPVTLGPIALYCGTSGSAYTIPMITEPVESDEKIPTTKGQSVLLIDTFMNKDSNSLGFYHGGDDSVAATIANSRLTINTKGNADLSWYTQVANGCRDLTPLQDGYLHIAYSGSNAFTVALQQHNPTCNDKIRPIPFTWDSVEASRYSNSAKSDIYVPLTHFNIDRTKSIGFGFQGFYTSNPTTLSKIEIVSSVPSGFLVPSKLPTASLVFSCTRPNSFAFAIDDGEPKFAQRIVSTVAEAGIKVTFFTVGAPLLDPSTNLTNVYKGMLDSGHQVAYHSYTHPPMEGLPSLAAIDWELNNDIDAVKKTLGITSTYFRPPFGTEGARVRQRLESIIPGSKFVMWSVDVQDYLWAQSPTPENQITNFENDVKLGGNLVVMHYLYETTVNYLPRFIAIAKSTGKQLMRVDQCMEDPNAPPL
ncbi:chitin deacetylase [Blumeria hordei DH14]|uniref:Chitin deacetylase n=1 Tax=Blumeria graminis f. sp. hordei (strain DH14) TaxID=546991 RepID=N1J6A1_BLUG1|nr:chitin deacetylase [Blumeria hordei DH14]